ncbi:BlaI/MecI/CopY family transcriptional regulator [Nocardioides panacisoli]|uniref:BlaI/MecI/CopY family transcriptional regulator n=1 Tax=Nocardioides panacisoli TaxID=627624 RepID=UPI001C62CA7B|nr:BlaI/MecI/CopY family transcriptional regulator [Nocardioides panacisoli]QYJ05419.1 BlaI/MecI/CopY family transcriptional regulator [Nocardioides panacisoli]
MHQLGRLEATVMERVWTGGRPVLVREVLEDLRSDRKIAYTTVMTVMENLYRKGFLTRERDGRAYRYTAARTRAEHTAGVMEEVLASAGDRSATLLHFVEHISADDLAELRAVLGEADEEETS